MAKQNSPLSLGTEKINTLLARYASPAIIGMTAASLYNIADSIFIGHGVGALAISGLALTFPVMNLAAAFGSLVGVGASTLLSIKLGQKDYESAHKVLGCTLVLNVILGVLFTFVGLAFLEPVLFFFGASEQTVTYASDYMTIILMGNVVTHIFFGLNAILRSAGYPERSMYATLVSVVINCLLNPVFIFGLGWGIKGAAVATITAQFISMIYQLVHFANPNRLIRFRKGIYRLDKVMVKDILSIGLSPFLMNACSCLITILINRGLKAHGGDLAIGAYGIVNRMAFFFVMVIMGLNQGMQPIAGYNYGARLYDRVKEVTKLTIKLATAVSTCGFLLCEFCPTLIARIFTTDAELTELAVYGLRVTFVVFPVIGSQMVITNFFVAVGMPKKSIFLSLTRQMIFLMPLLLILPHFLGARGVWLSLPLSDFMSAVLSWFIIFRHFKKSQTLPV